MLDALLKQAELARELLENDRPETSLSEKQIQVLNLFAEQTSLSAKQTFEFLNKEMPLPTIKQIFARLTTLRLIKRHGLGRATRYTKE